MWRVASVATLATEAMATSCLGGTSTRNCIVQVLVGASNRHIKSFKRNHLAICHHPQFCNMPRVAHLIGTFGLLMNECWMLEEGIKRGLVEYDPETYKYTREGLNSLSAMQEQIIYESGIPGLHVGCVWVGDGLTILSWVLPKSWRGPRSAKIDEQLKKFCELAHITFHQKPRWWASTDGDMPPILKGVTQVRGEIAAMQVESSRYWQPMPQHMPGYST